MREEIWRLYRHLILSVFAIVVCCFVAIEFAQNRFSGLKTGQLFNVDAEISAALLLSGVAKKVPESQFDWDLSSAALLPSPKISSLIKTKEWLASDEASYSVSFKQSATPILTGSASASNPAFQLKTLLERLLLATQLEYSEKVSLIESMSSLSMSQYDSQSSAVFSGVALVQRSPYEYGFLWNDDNAERPNYITITNEERVSRTLIVVVIISVGVVIMLLLIWRELIALDVKRKNFENITRQIARGRSGLPQGVPDNNGTLKELAYSFDSMSSHIERLLKVQREMINAISHELRTPIARLRFGLEMVKDEVDDDVGPTIEALEGDVEELNTLVDEVLTYGKLEGSSLELNFKELSVSQLIDEILQHNHLLLQHLTVNVSVDSADIVEADEHHISRALQNLILNASKYAASTITVSFAQDSERWQFDIEDDGPGIPFEDRDKVFIPFQRLDNSRTRASGGYGLGLAIVQRIAFWHGGAVLIDESESGGAKFSFIWSRNQHQKTVS
ncbi:ATP-binding protein [Marinomonas sp. 5E14-1]|uniref:ATP-binding protein n=1 Tax=Marinomonas sp. 5E14-1 TaxID=3153922 RepID=UPI003264E93D